MALFEWYIFICFWLCQGMWLDMGFVFQVSMNHWIVQETIIQEKGAAWYSTCWLSICARTCNVLNISNLVNHKNAYLQYLPRALIKIVHWEKLVVEDSLPPSSSSLYIVNRFMSMYILHVNIITNINLKLLIQAK